MITITKSAVEQIKKSARQSHAEGMALRLAISQDANKKLHYVLGFDDVGGGGDDTHYSMHGIDLLVSPASIALAEGMTIDYVELEKDGYQFIFINPNDPRHVSG